MRLTRETFASEAVALMGFEACAVLPAMLEGTLFVAGPYSALEYESVGAFTQSNPPFDDRICVPYVVRDLLYYQGLTYVLEDLHKRLALLPFVGSTVAEYLSIKKDTSGKGSYSERFLKYLDDLKVAAVEVKAAEDLLREIETHPSWSHFLDAPTTATTYRVRVPPLIRGSVIDIVTSEAGRALAHVRGDLTVGTDRQKSNRRLLARCGNFRSNRCKPKIAAFGDCADDRGGAHCCRVSAAARKAAGTLAKMPGSKIIKHAQAHKHVTASSAILYGWNDRTGKQEIGLTLNLLNLTAGNG